MRHHIIIIIFTILCSLFPAKSFGQINVDQVLRVGQNSLYLEDYILSIQYFNLAAEARPYWAQPYFYRAIAKLSLDDFRGAEEDASLAIERNPFITGAYEVRGVARQNMGRSKEAIADYDKALESLPDNRSILFNKALAQESMKDYEGAEVTFDRLLKLYPNFDNGFAGRAQMYLAMGDTVKAVSDIDRSIEINKNNTNAYVMRADIALKRGDHQAALDDMDQAIKLQPQVAGFYINRAFLRYNLNNYFGAMADYDYALQLEPLNVAALFNRGLLRAEVHDNNKAIDDFSKVLQLDRDNYHALYNRALLYKDIADYKSSIADLDRVLEAFPDFSGAYFIRSEDKRLLGDMAAAESDYRKSMTLTREAAKSGKYDETAPAPRNDNADMADAGQPENDDVAARLTTLLTVQNNADIHEEYNTPGIKGRVQDRNIIVEIEPEFTLSYYVTSSEIKESPYYIKEIDDVNATRMLRFLLMTTNRAPQLSDEDDINRHFRSIEYYNSYLAAHTPRPIDYFGRAMDYFTLRNYQAAIADLDRAIELSPDFALAYFLRSNARLLNSKAVDMTDDGGKRPLPGALGQSGKQIVEREAMADIDRVIELSPRMAFAHYNKGNLLVEMGDITSAISAYTKAIELKPDFGEAYYNRGYLYLKLGNREAGVADLSKAGELGIIPSYNLLKRISR